MDDTPDGSTLSGRAVVSNVLLLSAAADRAALSSLRERLEAVESRVDGLAASGDAGDGASLPPELLHKVVHACVASDRLDESEELAVLRALMGGE